VGQTVSLDVRAYRTSVLVCPSFGGSYCRRAKGKGTLQRQRPFLANIYSTRSTYQAQRFAARNTKTRHFFASNVPGLLPGTAPSASPLFI
jgi:hypothetical protein